jgi:plasmid stability protein
MTESWFYGKLAKMKTTLDMPDELMRRIKLRAVHRNRKLKDEIAQLLEAGMANVPASEAPRRPPKPVRLRGRGPLTTKEIEAAIAGGRK